jgi:hypothetical protein
MIPLAESMEYEILWERILVEDDYWDTKKVLSKWERGYNEKRNGRR